MILITQPEVHLLTDLSFIPHPKYEIPEGGTPAEQLIAMAGKGCYDSYGSDGRAIDAHIRSLVDANHGSVLEHANVSLFVSGISRGCSHEWVRHRAGFGYSQRSTRYTDESEAAIVLEPWMAGIHLNREMAHPRETRALDRFLASTRNSVEEYRLLVDDLMACINDNDAIGKTAKRKWARGKARQALPIATETRMTVTANLRAWRHFLFMRSSRFAEAEIRRVAASVYYTLLPLAPIVFQDFGINMVDGLPEFTTDLPKV